MAGFLIGIAFLSGPFFSQAPFLLPALSSFGKVP